jgi:hypothetical protein
MERPQLVVNLIHAANQGSGTVETNSAYTVHIQCRSRSQPTHLAGGVEDLLIRLCGAQG